METRITVIVDNHGSDALPGEWGLSLLAEHRGERILADAGASALFAKNLRTLGFDIASIDHATLSHAHYDHANGMPAFFRGNDHARFYVRESTAEDCYFKKFIFRKYIGIPKGMARDFPSRVVPVSGRYQVADGAWLIPHTTPGLSAIGRREMMYRKTPSGWQPDDFSHEQSLVLETDSGLVIINCCSHGGAANIIREAREAFPGRHVYGLIGGMHLFNKRDAEIRAVGQEILDTGIGFVCTGHCTGDRAMDILASVLGDRLHRLHTGLVMTF